MTFPPEIAVSLNDLMRLEHLVTDFSLLPRQPVHSVLSGKHASKLRGRGLDFSEVRKYVYGDDIRNIDWKVTARTKVTHTKVFNEEKERPAFLVVDQSTSMFFGSEGSVKSVVAAQMAAIAGFKVLKASDRIGGLIFDDASFETVAPKRNRKALLHMLELISEKNQYLTKRKKMYPKKAFINKVLFKAQNMITHDYVVAIISDFQELDAEGRIYLSNIARHNDVIAIMVSDQMERQLPAANFPVGDGDFQVMITDKQDVRKRFEQQSQQLREQNIQFLRKHKIPLMELNTKDPIKYQLKQLFGRS